MGYALHKLNMNHDTCAWIIWNKTRRFLLRLVFFFNFQLRNLLIGTVAGCQFHWALLKVVCFLVKKKKRIMSSLFISIKTVFVEFITNFTHLLQHWFMFGLKFFKPVWCFIFNRFTCIIIIWNKENKYQTGLKNLKPKISSNYNTCNMTNLSLFTVRSS